jgi:hypothetical protein
LSGYALSYTKDKFIKELWTNSNIIVISKKSIYIHVYILVQTRKLKQFGKQRIEKRVP